MCAKGTGEVDGSVKCLLSTEPKMASQVDMVACARNTKECDLSIPLPVSLVKSMSFRFR